MLKSSTFRNSFHELDTFLIISLITKTSEYLQSLIVSEATLRNLCTKTCNLHLCFRKYWLHGKNRKFPACRAQ